MSIDVLTAELGAAAPLAQAPSPVPTLTGVELDPHQVKHLFRHLPDLTTKGQGLHPDALQVAPAPPAPWQASEPVPGHQLRGTLDGHGRYVLRIPDRWNGRLVVAGTPGTRTEFAGDLNFSDYVLPKGYAYLAGDKGDTSGGLIGGARPTPKSPESPYGFDFALLRWSPTMKGWVDSLIGLTHFAQEQLALLKERRPERTYLLGISNGAYQVRRALETVHDLYDGGVDWEGVHWRVEGPNLFTHLPTALHNYPLYADPASEPATREAARQSILAARFPPDSEELWRTYHDAYWGVTQWLYARKLDPAYDGDPAGYNWARRPPWVHARVAELATTGQIARPLISLHGTLDCLLPPALHAVPYADMVRAIGRASLHRLYLVERANHVDNFAAVLPHAHLEPLLPHVRRAFDLLVDWVERNREAPPSKTVPVGGTI